MAMTTKSFFSSVQSLHAGTGTASLLDNDGSANIPRGFSANDRRGSCVSGAGAGTGMTGCGPRSRTNDIASVVESCSTCAWTCSTDSMSNNPARTIETFASDFAGAGL